MPRGRRTPHSAAALQRAVNHVELLEDRRLLTTLIGGETFDYYDAAGNTVRLRLVGNITAEFIAVRNGQFGRKIVRDLVPSQFGAGLVPADGADLFSIYIAQADSDAQIIMTRVPNPTQTDPVADDEDATPFTGSGSIRVSVEGKQTLLGLGEGGVYIGNRNPLPPTGTGGTTQTGFEPNTVLSYRLPYGVRPAQRSLIAGIQTAPGVSVGKIFIGGTITGSVGIGGSVDTFYAGNILTGDTAGTAAQATASSPNNFYVGGDLRNLLVSGSVGTLASSEDYATGTGIRVDGKLGHVDIGETFRSSLNVVNSSEIADPLLTPYSEVEYKLGDGETAGSAFLAGLLSTGFTNDADDDGQYGASFTTSSGDLQSLQFSGTLQDGESVDNYNVPLIAGQTITVDLDADIVGFAYVGLYDPQGRLVATDVQELSGSGANEAFRYTAQQPGNYRLQVTSIDATTGTYDFEAPAVLEGTLAYTLTVQNVGELAVGGVTAPDLLIDQANSGLAVRSGDLGALIGLDTIKSGGLATYTVTRGNLRVMESGVIGGVLQELFLSPQLSVPAGSVGLLRSTTGLLNVNPFGTTNGEDPDPSTAIGFDYQVVESATDFYGNLIANRAIGTVRAASIPGAPIIAANADNRGQDGRIDLIDVTGDFGTLATGGPGLFTGLGGNVKYVRVGGDVYNDPFFGGGLITPTTYALNEAVRFTDDSGARGVLTPTISTTTGTDTGGGTGGGTTVTNTPGQLTVTTYGIRGSGGVVIVNVASTTSVNVTAQGTRGSFDISTIETEGEGTAVAVGGNNTIGFETGTFPIAGSGTVGTDGAATGTVFAVPASVNAILLSGAVPVNVLDLQVGGGSGNLTRLNNTSPGEVVGINAGTIGYLDGRRFGLSENGTPAGLLLDSNITPTAFPLDAFSYGISTTNAISIRSAEGIGNLAVSERLGTLTVNADGTDRRDRFEGINGVVLVGDASRINIGEGVAFGGTGTNPTAGIFATGELNLVAGLNADVRGTIAAVDQIDRITLQGGSVVGARIQAGGDLDQTSFLVQAFTYTDVPNEDLPDTGTAPTDPNAVGPVHYSLGRLEVTGGGILGSYIGGGDFDQIRVAGGFGILGSAISFLGTNNASGSVSTDGLGIRGSFISPGNSLNLVAANGDGQRLNVNAFPASVRQSEKRRFDSFTGRPLAATNDLHRYLGTSATRGSISGVTNSGIIEDTRIVGAGNLRQLKAYHVRATSNDVPITSGSYPTRVSFASTIGKLDVTSAIDGLQVTTGRLDQLSAGGNIAHTRVQVSGRVGAVLSGRSIRGTFSMNVSGPDGELGRLFARQAYYGTTSVARNVGSVEVGTFGGQVQGSQGANQLVVTGDVVPSGSSATPTFFRVNGTLGRLFVGGSVQQDTTIRAGAITEQTVVGSVFGTIAIT